MAYLAAHLPLRLGGLARRDASELLPTALVRPPGADAAPLHVHIPPVPDAQENLIAEEDAGLRRGRVQGLLQRIFALSVPRWQLWYELLQRIFALHVPCVREETSGR